MLVSPGRDTVAILVRAAFVWADANILIEVVVHDVSYISAEPRGA